MGILELGFLEFLEFSQGNNLVKRPCKKTLTFSYFDYILIVGL